MDVSNGGIIETVRSLRRRQWLQLREWRACVSASRCALSTVNDGPWSDTVRPTSSPRKFVSAVDRRSVRSVPRRDKSDRISVTYVFGSANELLARMFTRLLCNLHSRHTSIVNILASIRHCNKRQQCLVSTSSTIIRLCIRYRTLRRYINTVLLLLYNYFLFNCLINTT